MAGKLYLTKRQKMGLHPSEILLAEKYIRSVGGAAKTRIDEHTSLAIFELFLVGASFRELSEQFNMPVGRLIAHCAMERWIPEKEKLMLTLRDRVQAKVVKAVSDQVDFLTTMLSVTNTENMQQMRKYLADPEKKNLPKLRIETLKQYKEVTETLQKVLISTMPGNNSKENNSVLSNLDSSVPTVEKRQMEGGFQEPRKAISVAQIIEQHLEDDGEDENSEG